jgi:hypothetical protein
MREVCEGETRARVATERRASVSDLDDVLAALRALQDAEWERYLTHGTADLYQQGVVDGTAAAVSCVMAMIRGGKPPFADK